MSCSSSVLLVFDAGAVAAVIRFIRRPEPEFDLGVVKPTPGHRYFVRAWPASDRRRRRNAMTSSMRRSLRTTCDSSP